MKPRPTHPSLLTPTALASLTVLTLLTVLTFGCLPRPQHGGRAITSGGITQTLLQGENASQPSRQSQDTFRTRTYTLPTRRASVTLVPSVPSVLSNSAAPVIITDSEETHALTELGASQKDTSRELTARLSSLRGIVWVGLGMFLFGLASLFYPPLRVIIGSITTSAAITLGGVALMILPTLVVGHELLILGCITVAVGGWFLAHRHGHARGQLATVQKSSSPRK